MSIAKYRRSNNITVRCWSRTGYGPVQFKSGKSGKTVVNGTAMVMAIAITFSRFVGAKAMRRVQMTFGVGPGELVGNRPASAHGSCLQLTCLKGDRDYG